jgi:hypothetical protein
MRQSERNEVSVSVKVGETKRVFLQNEKGACEWVGGCEWVGAGNSKGVSITIQLTSCLTGLD